jgi:hypothetical protein
VLTCDGVDLAGVELLVGANAKRGGVVVADEGIPLRGIRPAREWRIFADLKIRVARKGVGGSWSSLHR